MASLCPGGQKLLPQEGREACTHGKPEMNTVLALFDLALAPVGARECDPLSIVRLLCYPDAMARGARPQRRAERVPLNLIQVMLAQGSRHPAPPRARFAGSTSGRG